MVSHDNIDRVIYHDPYFCQALGGGLVGCTRTWDGIYGRGGIFYQDEFSGPVGKLESIKAIPTTSTYCQNK